MHYGSARIRLKSLTSDQKQALTVLCGLSRSLYNSALEEVSGEYQQSGKVLDFQTLKNRLRESQAYTDIGGWYYATILQAVFNYQKYLRICQYAARKSKEVVAAKNLGNIQSPKKAKRTFPIYLRNPFRDNGLIVLPKTKYTDKVKLTLPKQYADKHIFQIELIPNKDFEDWEAIINYPLPDTENPVRNSDLVMGIDLGVSNFCTCFASNGKSFIVDGRRLKSIIQGHCKYWKKLSARNNRNTKRLNSLSRKTRNKIRDYTDKAVVCIVNYCLENQIGKIVVGWGIHFQNFTLGKHNNQLFGYFPYAKFVDSLKAKCYRYHIRFFKTDESFTSQASALDLDKMPVRVTTAKQNFSGHRRYRGIYITHDGTKINADINGAINILRKCNAVTAEQIARLGSRGLVPPKRIKFPFERHPASPDKKGVEELIC